MDALPTPAAGESSLLRADWHEARDLHLADEIHEAVASRVVIAAAPRTHIKTSQCVSHLL